MNKVNKSERKKATWVINQCHGAFFSRGSDRQQTIDLVAQALADYRHELFQYDTCQNCGQSLGEIDDLFCDEDCTNQYNEDHGQFGVGA